MSDNYRYLIVVLLALFSCQGAREHRKELVAVTGSRIEIGFVDSVYSHILKENRKIWVYVPNCFNNPVFCGQKHYPVVYLLDGEAHFHSFTGMIDQLSEENGNMVCPDMMVVGILNTNRTRDLTPTADTSIDDENGEGELFSAFIEKELIPHVDSLYHPDPFRVLLGHSYGGLTVINTLLHHAQPFNAFIALDPSLTWDNCRLLHQADTLLRQTDFQNKFLFVAMANTMSTDMDLRHVKQDTAHENDHIRSILTLIDHLQQKKPTRLNWDYNYYEDEDHYSVPFRGAYDALHFIFRDYAFTAYAELFDSSTSADSAKNIIETHFRYESSRLGVQVHPPEHFINSLAYSCMNSGMTDKALAFFKMNIDHYPASGNVYDSMGDFYAHEKDTTDAIKYYKMALNIVAMAATKDKLKNLTGK